MRKLTTFLVAIVVTAWMAYLSWPVTAERPSVREKTSDVFEPSAYEMREPA